MIDALLLGLRNVFTTIASDDSHTNPPLGSPKKAFVAMQTACSAHPPPKTRIIKIHNDDVYYILDAYSLDV
jgi:hypothetical protein